MMNKYLMAKTMIEHTFGLMLITMDAMHIMTLCKPKVLFFEIEKLFNLVVAKMIIRYTLMTLKKVIKMIELIL